MSMNSPDYLTYKKSKINPEGAKRRSSRLRIAFWIFIITFSVMFAIVVQVVRKYATRVDIEYGRNQAGGTVSADDNSILSQSFGSDAKKAIDKRLKLIQLEENAPNEAKVISPDAEKNEVIDLEQFAKLTESDKEDIEEEITIDTKKNDSAPEKETQSNIQVYSKVLIGKYASFEEARAAQDSVRSLNQGVTPFVRKVGDIYALQVGSYQDINIAKSVASKFRAANFDVWIYQQ